MDEAAPGTTFFQPEFEFFCPFRDYQSARRQPTCWWQHFFSRKQKLFDKIIMHLLHTCTHCDLDYSSSILHKFPITVTWISFIVGVDWGIDTKLYRGTLPERTWATTLKMAAKKLMKPNHFINVAQTAQGTMFSATNWRLLSISCPPDCTGATTVMLASFFQPKTDPFR